MGCWICKRQFALLHQSASPSILLYCIVILDTFSLLLAYSALVKFSLFPLTLDSLKFHLLVFLQPALSSQQNLTNSLVVPSSNETSFDTLPLILHIIIAKKNTALFCFYNPKSTLSFSIQSSIPALHHYSTVQLSTLFFLKATLKELLKG